MASSSPSVGMPYLPTSRQFPADSEQLQGELIKSYSEVAQAVNKRSIGTFNLFQAVTGDQWFSSQTAQSTTPLQFRQSYRKVFQLPATAAGATTVISHGITGITQCVSIFGTCVTAVPDFRPIPYASATLITNQIEVNVTSSQINIINGATSPNLTSGTIVLEYLLN